MSGRRVLVAGFGVTGRSVARSLAQAGDRVTVVDDNLSADTVSVGRALGLVVEQTPTGAALETLIASCDLVVPSPGIPIRHPIYAVAEDLGVEVRSEIELAAEASATSGAPKLLAITGTNGKTTVTTLVTEMLNQSGVKAVAAGNIGVPLIESVGSAVEVVVAEVSSFQLQFTHRFRPAVSCWLNFAEDHLDWHPTLEHYRSAKARIWANQRGGDTAVVNADDDGVVEAATRLPEGVTRIEFSIKRRADYMVTDGYLIEPDGSRLIAIDDLPRAFPHDIANALAATAVARAAGAGSAPCRQVLASAAPLPHRVSWVADRGGVSWYDDSKATTPASVLAAVAGFSSVVLIAGGRNKGLGLHVLSGTVPPVRAVVGIGEAAEEIRSAFSGSVPVTTASSMQAAVEAAQRLARPGDVVLLSPGCASFDWYSSYAARGDDFTSIVIATLGERGDRADG